MKRLLLCAGLLSAMLFSANYAAAVSFSVDRGSHGTSGSALDAAPGTGTVPNTVFNSELNGTNTVGISGHETGTSGTWDQGGNRYGQNVDAIHFGPGIDASGGLNYYFSLDWGAGYGTGPYPPGSGTAAAQGTETAPANVYYSTGNGTNENPYPFPGPDMGIEPEESNLDAFDLQDFTSAYMNGAASSSPLYFSLDLFRPTGIDLDDDGTADITVSGGDILVSHGGGTFSIAVYAYELGLDEDDNLDALTMLSDGSWLFSTDYESQGLQGTAVRNASGTGRRPANIYQSYGDGTNTLWLDSSHFGLLPGYETNWEQGPNIDALDVIASAVPEPNTLLLLGSGLVVFGLARRSYTRRVRH